VVLPLTCNLLLNKNFGLAKARPFRFLGVKTKITKTIEGQGVQEILMTFIWLRDLRVNTAQ
jgi:hypothetical protein